LFPQETSALEWLGHARLEGRAYNRRTPLRSDGSGTPGLKAGPTTSVQASPARHDACLDRAVLPRRLRRLRGFDYRGRHAYTVVLTAFQRRPHFNDPATVGVASAKILQAAKAEGFAIAAYCFMQDHVPVVVRGTRDDASLPSFIKRAKQTSVSFSARDGWRALAYRVFREDVEGRGRSDDGDPLCSG
jgi:REP element-mobilizing transposase RayT